MIVIALDEQGDFENQENKIDSEPVFIGGVIYDDNGNENDYSEEIKRLTEYFKKYANLQALNIQMIYTFLVHLKAIMVQK